MLPCRCTLLPPAARRPITGVIVTVRQARRWSATLLDRRTGLRQALHFWIGVYIYLTESLHTFRIGSLLSSTITLGCASEKALLLLIDAYANALPQSKQAKFRNATQVPLIKR